MRIALGIEYVGSLYHGWQSQVGLMAVQTCLEAALAKVADHPINVVCAGRTDAGVHALGQVVHFDTDAVRTNRAWILGVNSYLPDDIRIQWAQVMPEDFHARFTAVARRYCYVIYNHFTPSAILQQRVTWQYHPLDESRMAEAAQYLLGAHDFSSFRGLNCQAKTPIRDVQHLSVTRYHHFIILDIKANAFLYHMVRNIAGVLIAIGTGKQEPIWAKQVLAAKDRAVGGVTAPPEGLYLKEVSYPESFLLPKPAIDFPFMNSC